MSSASRFTSKPCTSLSRLGPIERSQTTNEMTASKPPRKTRNTISKPSPRALSISASHHVRVFLFAAETLLLLELDAQPQPADLVAEHVEAHRRAGFQRVRALDHRLVDLRAALDVVGLHRQEFLKDVARAVRLKAPHFHLAEPLAAPAG